LDKPQTSAKPQQVVKSSKIDNQQKTAKLKAKGKATAPKPKARK